MGKIPKNISQAIIDEIYQSGFTTGYNRGLSEVWPRAWVSGVRQAIRLRPRYYRPHNEKLNIVLDSYFERLKEAIKKPPKPHKAAPSPNTEQEEKK